MSVKVDGVVKLMCEMAPGTPHWNVDDAPDQTGRVIMITGGNIGVGYETAKALLKKNATVYICSRSLDKGNQAAEELRKETGNLKVFVLQMDLADLTTIRKAVDEFESKESKLHVLINNAGVMIPPLEQLTAQDYDLQFGTNVIGHYYFTKLLLPLLERTASSRPSTDPVRVLDLTSDYHLLGAGTGANIIDYTTLRDGEARRRAGTRELYCQSKSANIFVSNWKARHLTGKNMVFVAVHPGHISSGLQRHLDGMQAKMAKALAYPTPMGAINSVWAATISDAQQLNGKYVAPWARIKPPRKDHVDNLEAEEKVVKYLEEQLELNGLS